MSICDVRRFRKSRASTGATAKKCVAVHAGHGALVQDHEVFVTVLTAGKAAGCGGAHEAFYGVDVGLFVAGVICVPFDADVGVWICALTLLEILEVCFYVEV